MQTNKLEQHALDFGVMYVPSVFTYVQWLYLWAFVQVFVISQMFGWGSTYVSIVPIRAQQNNAQKHTMFSAKMRVLSTENKAHFVNKQLFLLLSGAHSPKKNSSAIFGRFYDGNRVRNAKNQQSTRPASVRAVDKTARVCENGE